MKFLKLRHITDKCTQIKETSLSETLFRTSLKRNEKTSPRKIKSEKNPSAVQNLHEVRFFPWKFRIYFRWKKVKNF